MTVRPEHSPKPGATWERRVVRREVIVPDGPWDGLPVRVTPWTEDGPPKPAPQPNRATRRAAARAARKASR